MFNIFFPAFHTFCIEEQKESYMIWYLLPRVYCSISSSSLSAGYVSLDTSRLLQYVLTYPNQRFFDFIQNFWGKDEADLLPIQAIRSADLFLCIQDLYCIFALDSEDVDLIQKRCAFNNRNQGETADSWQQNHSESSESPSIITESLRIIVKSLEFIFYFFYFSTFQSPNLLQNEKK